MTTQDVPWVWRGVPEHDQLAGNSAAVRVRLGQIFRGLNLVAYVIQRATESVNYTRAANELSALACYARAFRALRAATILAMSGMYLEARVYLRDVYESAGLGRVLAKRPDKADDWLLRDRWVRDNEVRQYIESVLMPGVPADQSPYREYYRQASDLHHPTRRGCLPLVLAGPDSPAVPRLGSEFDEEELDEILHEIAIEASFVCFTVVNAAPDQDVIPPDWRRELHDLSVELVPEGTAEHLRRNWQEDEERFAELNRHVIGASELDAELDRQPNSVRNIRRRRDQARDEAQGG